MQKGVPGRKPLPVGKRVKLHIVSVVLHERTARELDRIRGREPRSAYVRRIVEAHIRGKSTGGMRGQPKPKETEPEPVVAPSPPLEVLPAT